MNLKFNNHDFINFDYGDLDNKNWFRCNKCNVEIYYSYIGKEIQSFYLNKDCELPDEELEHLNCEEIIIKNIIE